MTTLPDDDVLPPEPAPLLPVIPVAPASPSLVWGDVATSLALLGGAAASVGLGVATMLLQTPVRDIVERNAGSPAERTALVITALASAALPVLTAMVAVLARPALAPALERLASRASPLTVFAALPALFTWRGWSDQPLTYLVLLAVVGFGLRASLPRFFATLPVAAPVAEPTTRLARWAPLATVVTAALAYGVYFSFYTIRNHHRFQTSGFDLGIYDNLMFNATRGEPFRATVLFGPDGGNNLASHAEFAVILYTPFYALFPRAENLLVAQSFLLGGAAIPLFLFASRLLPRWTAALLALGYLFYAPLHGPNFYDFHWLPLAVFFHFWLYWGITTRRWGVVAAMLLVLYSIREDIAVGLVGLGLFLIFSNARPRFGALLTLLSAAWFAVDKFVIMAWAGKWWFSEMYKDLMGQGERGYGSVIKTMLVNPTYTLSTVLKGDKLTYFLHLTAPLAMLPTRRIGILLLASAASLFTLLTTGYGPTIQISFQYTTHWIPYLFGTTVLALHSLGQLPRDGLARQRGAIGALLVVVLAHSYVFGALLQHNSFVGGFAHIQFAMSDGERLSYAEFREVIAHIPRGASVAASDNLVAHVSSRRDVYTLKSHHGDADFLLFTRSNAHASDIKAKLTEALARNTYGLAAQKGEYFLLQKGARSPDTTSALEALGLGKTSGGRP